MTRMRPALISGLLLAFASLAAAETIFVEAETFQPSSDGWRVVKNRQTRSASRLTSLNGARGDPKGSASRTITVHEFDSYRIWVRHIYHEGRRGAFRLAVLQDGKELAGKDFDLKPRPKSRNWSYVWDAFDADLPDGKLELRLTKCGNKNCSGYVRHVDCILITTDKDLPPSYVPYARQTYLRVALGDIYERGVYVHVFADHYRDPWYAHYSLSRAGTTRGIRPPPRKLLLGGESTPWCNITPMLYQDSGAILNFTVRRSYTQRSERLKARFEFASAPNEESIVRTMDVEAEPNGLVVVAPPDLVTIDNQRRLKRDKEFAEATGRIADAYDWPTIGRKPERFPFFVTATLGGYGTQVDKDIEDRERKTLNYFGFCNDEKSYIGGGIWYMKEESHCRPDVERMEKAATARAEAFRKKGKTAQDIVFCMLMDEPGGKPAEFLAQDQASCEAFRAWLRKLGKTPQDLLVADWDAVRPVPETERDKHPALHYFTQRFRTRALGDFLATQRRIVEKAYGGAFPVLVNFSDGATYFANFYGQGVDYFELLGDDGQNAIWGEDWANHSSGYQCAAYNVDLMRAAARRRGQTIGHYIIAYAGRKPWDIKLKTAGEVARGAKILKNYFYGVSWGSHSRGWYDRPAVWRAIAESVREVGGAEDLLFPAMPAPAQAAILYSSSTDAWTLRETHAYGFDRMNTWLALTHAQVPVDILSERYVADGMLDAYRVCYLAGPNLTRAAAAKLKTWVEGGGTLFLTAGAAVRDEFNRPLDILEPILPVKREEPVELQQHRSAGKFLYLLKPRDEVSAGKAKMDVLAVKQSLTPRKGAIVSASFGDGSPALVRGAAGKGSVYCAGFLPGLDYVRKALVARRELAEEKKRLEENGAAPSPAQQKAFEKIDRSYNPWEYPDDVRRFILAPVRLVGIEPPLTCSVPLVDAVAMACEQGLVIPLANYTLEPIAEVDFSVQASRPVERIESIYHGRIKFHRKGDRVEFCIPLECTDFVKIYYEQTSPSGQE